jgi:hypothetical protein
MSIIAALFIVAWWLVTYFVVFVERGQRKILVNYARRRSATRCMGPVVAPAAEAEHGRGDSADLRFVDHPAAGHGGGLVQHR